MSGLNEKSRDPSMEDVLASIRKIIAEELDAAHHAALDDIGPLDHNLPWAERQSNRQTKKSAPVLPIQTVSEANTINTHDIHAGSEAEVASSVMTISDTVVSEAQRAAVAEFEQAVTALPVHDGLGAVGLPQDIFNHDHASGMQVDEPSAHESHTSEMAPVALFDAVQEAGAITDWQSTPLPFEALQFLTTGDEAAGGIAATVEPSLVEVDAPVHGSADPVTQIERVSDANIYSEFLDAQKPQLNVKLDLSFLDKTIYHHGQSDKASETVESHDAVTVAAPVSMPDPVLPPADYSIFSDDRGHAPLPSFIPANEPSYSPLVSQRTTDALLSSLRQLTEATHPPAPAVAVQEKTPAPRLDEFMADVLRPLLSQWLDANLERIVDQAVRDEIAKVTQKIHP